MTPKQRGLYAALRALGHCLLQPEDTRPARALKRRGLATYRRIDGVRCIALKQTKAERIEKARLRRWKKYDFWPNQTRSNRGNNASRSDRPARRRHL